MKLLNRFGHFRLRIPQTEEGIRGRDKIWGFFIIHIFNIMGLEELSLGKGIFGGTEIYGVPKLNLQKYERRNWNGDWQKWPVTKKRALVRSKKPRNGLF